MRRASTASTSSKKLKPKPKSKVKCSEDCKGSSDNLLVCNNCKTKFHCECVEFNVQLFKLLSENSCPGLSWSWNCDSCVKIIQSEGGNHKAELNDLKSLIRDEVKSEIDFLKNDLSSLVSDINLKLSNLHENSKVIPTVGNQIAKISEEFSSQKLKYAEIVAKGTETHSEIKEIKTKVTGISSSIQNKAEIESEKRNIISRQLNVCVFNVPEPTSNDPETQFKEDIVNIKEILKEKADLRAGDFIALRRIGKVVDNKRRPIILKLESQEKRTELLSLRNLQISKNGEISKVSIVPDLTYKQQQARKKLWAELKDRNEKGEQNLVIRNNKVVPFNPFKLIPKNYWD